jgi:hypothetical protein
MKRNQMSWPPVAEFFEACRNVMGDDSPKAVLQALQEGGETSFRIKDEYARILGEKE